MAKESKAVLVDNWYRDEKPDIFMHNYTNLFHMFEEWAISKQSGSMTYACFVDKIKRIKSREMSKRQSGSKTSKVAKPVRPPKETLVEKEENIRVTVDLLANGWTNGFILSGPTGTGKTSLVIQRLEQLGLEYHYHKGAVSNALELYKYLYHHRRDQILVIDDTGGLIGSNETCGDIISAALDDNHIQENVVSYLHKSLKHPAEIADMPDGSIRKQKAVPNKFLITSGMIFLTNTPMSEISKAIGSRCFPLDYWLTKDEILCKIETHLKDIHPQEPIKLKREVLNFFIKNKEDMKRFDLRTFKKACLLRFAHGQMREGMSWERMVMTSVNSGS